MSRATSLQKAFLTNVADTNYIHTKLIPSMMDRSSNPNHPSMPRVDLLLCDKRRDPILQPGSDRSKRSFSDMLKELAKTWTVKPRPWPVGFLIESPYSPLRVERELSNLNWWDAFEDLLALETGGEMIS